MPNGAAVGMTTQVSRQKSCPVIKLQEDRQLSATTKQICINIITMFNHHYISLLLQEGTRDFCTCAIFERFLSFQLSDHDLTGDVVLSRYATLLLGAFAI